MGIGTSIFLLAVGAILTFATDLQVSGLDLNVVGIILMIVGGIGLVISIGILSSRRRATHVVKQPVQPTTRRTIVEE